METSPSGLLFADSIRPQLIHGGFGHVAAYADGLYKWPTDQLVRFSRHFCISVTGDPAAAVFARGQDVERYDARPADFPVFAMQRKQHGHDDALSYMSISNVGAVVDEVKAAGIYEEPWWWLWVAWWTEDGHAPTRDEVVTELQVAYGVHIEPKRVKACQFVNGADNDTSLWYGADDFTITRR